MPDNTIRGRFAPSPSGRLHLGNMLTFLLAWLDVRARGKKNILIDRNSIYKDIFYFIS